MTESPFKNLSRWIMVKLSIVGALLSPLVSPAATEQLPVELESLSFADFWIYFWLSIWSPAGAQALALAAIGGFVGLIYYTVTFYWKQHLIKRSKNIKSEDHE